MLDSGIYITWQPPQEGNATNYRVEWKALQNESTLEVSDLLAVSTNLYLINNLSPGQPYQISIIALNAGGEGHPSTTILPAATIPSAPRSLDLQTDADRNMVITWLAPETDGHSPITSYELEYVLTSKTWNQATLHSLTATELTLQPAAGTYKVRVTAINLVGRGPLSAVKEITILPAATIPSAPRSLDLQTDADRNMVITWLAPETDGHSPITSYELEYVLTSKTWNQATLHSLTATELTLQPAAGTYKVRVTAINLVGRGPLSAVKEITILPAATIPSAPRSLDLQTDADRNMVITWLAPETDGHSPITSYELGVCANL